MPRFPFMNFPFPYYNNRRFSNPYTNLPLPSFSATFQTEKADDFQFEDQKNKSNNNSNDYLFDLFGLKIFTDDVLLVSLIYFLYTEDVKDEGLFIVLILLLLS